MTQIHDVCGGRIFTNSRIRQRLHEKNSQIRRNLKLNLMTFVCRPDVVVDEKVVALPTHVGD